MSFSIPANNSTFTKKAMEADAKNNELTQLELDDLAIKANSEKIIAETEKIKTENEILSYKLKSVISYADMKHELFGL